jgi:hypothetical protein
MSESVRITGTKIVAIDKYSRFDPSNPAGARFEDFSLSTPTEEGVMGEYWMREGYIQVGTAKVEIELMPRKEVTAGAVASLRKQKDALLAKAQLEATQIEQQIQNLLAITNEA